eukprot:m.123417 g.123417  ORF g.123417 m.123417 type:complete len:188 (+) comp15678_c0_seq2:1849-2412(+)
MCCRSDGRDAVSNDLYHAQWYLCPAQGLLVFLVFGTKRKVNKPLFQALARLRDRCRRMLHAEAEVVVVDPVPFHTLDPVVQQHVRQFELLRRRFEDSMVKDRRYKLKSYKKVFRGCDLVSFLIEEGLADERDEAVLVGKQLMTSGLFEHVHRDHWLEDGVLFYRFCVSMNDEETGETMETGDSGEGN